VKNGFPGLSSIVDVPDPSLADLPDGTTHVHAARAPSLFGTVVGLRLCGTDDAFLAEAQQAVPVLTAAGVAVEWTTTPGGHD
jgi:hypothetical protein